MNELNQWLDVEGNVQRVMKPVSAPPAFRAHLRNGLLLAAQHQQTQRVVEYKSESTSWVWLFYAALLGSLIGFIVIQLYLRKTQNEERVLEFDT